MATADQVSALRLLIAETDETTYTDSTLSDRLDEVSGDLDVLAVSIWTEKAAKYSGLVDVTEGGSSRKMGDLQEQALKMAAVFKGRVHDSTANNAGGVVLRRLRRA